ncbi:MAG: hypothetical protein IR153_07540 [Flavobacterium sp.]|nr:hypothetical protein [Flavobacterium sp.]
MNIILLILLAPTYCFLTNMQEVEFVGKKIVVADYYKIKTQGIESTQNRLHWKYFTEDMISKDEDKKTFAEMNSHMIDVKKTSRRIKLISHGDTIYGTKYNRKSRGIMNYNIIAIGTVNKRRVIISYISAFDPNSNSKLDATIKQFFKIP